MRFGLFLPPFDEFADPGRVVELAVAAEEAGWQGLFLWDHILAGVGRPVADPWITMAGIATATRTIRSRNCSGLAWASLSFSAPTTLNCM